MSPFSDPPTYAADGPRKSDAADRFSVRNDVDVREGVVAGSCGDSGEAVPKRGARSIPNAVGSGRSGVVIAFARLECRAAQQSDEYVARHLC
jgi:hypothetical protein